MNFTHYDYLFSEKEIISRNIIYIPQTPSYIVRLHLNYNYGIYMALLIMLICICYINHLKNKLFSLLQTINEENNQINNELKNQKIEIIDLKKKINKIKFEYSIRE